MNLNDIGTTSLARCDANLPDSPQCAPNYFFGMLLGVDDFRAEQGFHLGQHRRHQRSLHGAGVVAGYDVSFKDKEMEIRVAPGQAVDLLGRDLALATAQCVSLPLWWQAHRTDDAFHDVPDPNDATLDLDVVLGYRACLSEPVPAIADPCAGAASDIAYSRLCETTQLSLVRSPTAPAAADDRFHLLRLWLNLDAPQVDDQGQTLAADRWLLDAEQALLALPATDRAQARQRLAAEVLARTVAELPPTTLDPQADADRLGLPLARLHGVHLKQDASGWQVAVASIDLGGRPSLLPTGLLQSLLFADPAAAPPLAGPAVASGGLVLAGQQLSVAFTQPLAAPTVAAALAVTEFVDAQGWKRFTPTVSCTAGATAVQIDLGRAPVGSRLRLTVVGTGATPLLGANLVPAGALDPESDGRDLSTTLKLD